MGVLLFAYLIGGYALIALGVWTPPYEFLSLTEDIYFAWLGFLPGVVVCFGTASLIGLAFLTEGEGRIHNEVLILASFIGFGFGASLLRMTYATVLTTLVNKSDVPVLVLPDSSDSESYPRKSRLYLRTRLSRQSL